MTDSLVDRMNAEVERLRKHGVIHRDNGMRELIEEMAASGDYPSWENPTPYLRVPSECRPGCRTCGGPQK